MLACIAAFFMKVSDRIGPREPSVCYYSSSIRTQPIPAAFAPSTPGIPSS